MNILQKLLAKLLPEKDTRPQEVIRVERERTDRILANKLRQVR